MSTVKTICIIIIIYLFFTFAVKEGELINHRLYTEPYNMYQKILCFLNRQSMNYMQEIMAMLQFDTAQNIEHN